MKKLALIIAVLPVLCLCSCLKSTPENISADDTYRFETDAQYTFFNQGGDRIFAESEDGYYFSLTLKNHHYLFFTDKETMQTVPVCSKPNCLHYAETDTDRMELCNAYYFGLSYEASLFYNDGKLYIPIRDIAMGKDDGVIMEFSLDGSSRKEIFRFKDFRLSACNMLFHRGFLYIIRTAYNERQEYCSQIWRYSLSHPSKKPECLYEVKAEMGRGIMDLMAYGDNLYFAIRGEEKKIFHKMNLSNMKVSPIFDIAKGFDLSYNLAIMGDKLLYEMTCPGEDPDVDIQNLDAVMYTGDLDGGNIQKWMDTTYTCYNADDRYVYRWTLYAFDTPGEGHCLKIYDLEGNLMTEYKFSENLPEYRSVYVSPGEHVFITYGARTSVYYFAKSEIETGEIHPKLLIDCSQYE